MLLSAFFLSLLQGEMLDARLDLAERLSGVPIGPDGPDGPFGPGIGGAQDVNFKTLYSGMIVFLFNTQFPYERLSMYGSNGKDCYNCQCGMWNGIYLENQLWQLEKASDDWGLGNDVWIMSSHTQKQARWSYNPSFGDTKNGWCYGGPYFKDEGWTFTPAKANSTNFIIGSANHPTCKMAVWSQTGGGGIYCGTNEYWPATQFNVKSPFARGTGFPGPGAGFQVADSFNNMGPNKVNFEFHYQKGFTETIKQSIATTTSWTVTISFTIQAMFDGSGFSNTDMWSMTKSTTESFERACSESYLESESISYPVMPGQHICLYQAAVPQIKDLITKTEFGFKSSYFEIKECGAGHSAGMFITREELPSGPVLGSPDRMNFE